MAEAMVQCKKCRVPKITKDWICNSLVNNPMEKLSAKLRAHADSVSCHFKGLPHNMLSNKVFQNTH